MRVEKLLAELLLASNRFLATIPGSPKDPMGFSFIRDLMSAISFRHGKLSTLQLSARGASHGLGHPQVVDASTPQAMSGSDEPAQTPNFIAASRWASCATRCLLSLAPLRTSRGLRAVRLRVRANGRLHVRSDSAARIADVTKSSAQRQVAGALIASGDRLETLAGRYFREHHAHESVGTFQVAIGGRAAPALPMLERRRLKISDAVAADDREPIFLAPLQKRRLARVPFRRSVIQGHWGTSESRNWTRRD